jgi:Ser/Thr protein kinase RdoA (MazF antagonist)
LNIERRTTGIVAAQIVALGVTFGAAIPLMKYGLTGVGIAMLLGMAATSICFYFVFLYNRHHRLPDTESLDTPLANDELYVASQENIAPVLAAYGISHFAFKQLHNGSSSYTFLVRADAKLKVLRIYKKDKKTDHQIEQELAFMHFLAEHGIPVPRVIENIHNNTLASTKIGSTSWQHVLMDYEPGKHPRKYTSAILFRMAQIQAQIHIHGIAYAKDKHQSRTDIKQLKSADDHNKGMLSFLHLAPKGFSHFDFDASNILIDDKQITCVLDFEGMHYGPLVTCIYFTLTRIYDLQPQADDIRLYLTSYQHIRSLNMFEKAILGFALALHYRSPRLLFVHSR